MAQHESCYKCGAQPVATKGKTYWTARCPTAHVLGHVSATPMKTKSAALEAWDMEMRRIRSFAEN